MNKKAGEAEKYSLPRHIAIIMDGNRRWARRRGLPSAAGHHFGGENFRKIATYCKNIGIKYLTVYAFSTENWKRSEDEIKAIMELLEKYLNEAIEKMQKEGIKLYIMGDTGVLPPKLKALVERTSALSKSIESGFQVNLCINYGGRDEILRAAANYARDYKNGRAGEADEALFTSYLYSGGIPDPDLVIRPSGELRISNFLLWQSAYSEFYFTKTLWPDFDERELEKAINDFRGRNRRLGK